MSYETIRVDRDGPLLTITLNRPERLNAMPPAMADEIGQAFYDLSAGVDTDRAAFDETGDHRQIRQQR